MGARSLRNSILLSIFIHLCIVLAWVCLVHDQATDQRNKKLTWIEVESNSKKNEETSKRRIVQTEIKEKSTRAKPDAFLGLQNQIVDHQTVSKNKVIIAGNQNKVGSKDLHKSNEIKSNSNSNSLGKFGLAILPKDSEKFTDEPVWATPGTRAEDFVPGMTESDRTALNTKEFVFYSYFQRIRSRLDQAWVPILREKLAAYYRNGRHLASEMDHTTRVLVILNDKGNIIRVKVLSESGTRDLDDAAIGAFNRAGPFPNPPKGMMDSNREVQIPWDFILKT